MRPRTTAVVVVALAALLGAAAWWFAATSPGAQVESAGWQLQRLLGGEPGAAFQRITGVAPLSFPADHGPHPGYRHEWWYLTGNVAADSGRRFGFQATFFRFALPPGPAPAAPSAWRSRDLYLAHFAVSDIDGGRFRAFERFARGALGLAGARAEPFRVWLEEWSLESAQRPFLPLLLRMHDRGIGLELALDSQRPIVAQGELGYSRKGPDPGNATRYYSLTRLDARGRLLLPDGEHRVTGAAWLDREWGSSALPDDLVGWDWFALQLDDGRDLMLYRLRRADGSASPYSAGSLVTADGRVERLGAGDFSVMPRTSWRAADGTVYPAAWQVNVPGAGLQLEVEPLLEDQELRLSVRYWEGAVRVSGDRSGRGYVELTGYAVGRQGRGRGG